MPLHHTVLRRAQTENLRAQLGAHPPIDRFAYPLHSGERSEQREATDEKEEEWKITNCELFFDLAFVVMLHVIALPLEEQEAVLPWLWLRVILVIITAWSLWFNVSDYALASRFYPETYKLDSTIIFIVMICAGFMSMAGQHGDLPRFVVWYLISSVLVILGCIHMGWKRTSGMSPDDVSFMRQSTYVYIFVLLADAACLVPASFIAAHPDNDNHLDAGLVLWMVAVIMKILIAVCFSQKKFGSVDMPFSDFRPYVTLWLERYQLVVIISLGEIVVAAASGQKRAGDMLEPSAVAFGGMLMAISCYLLYFAVHPPSWKHPLELTLPKLAVEGFLTVFMVCALASIGATYSRFLEVAAEPEETNEENLRQTFKLFSLATCFFLWASSVVIFLGEESAPAGQQTRYSSKVRGVVRTATGIIIGLVTLLPLELQVSIQLPLDFKLMGWAAIPLVVPCALLTLAAFETWASETRRVPAFSSQ